MMRNRRLPFYECREGIIEIDEFDCASIFVIVGKERALVLDTGTGIGDLRWVIENKITNKPYDVVITHNHGDHIGGAGFFDKVWVHEKDMDWSSKEFGPSLEFRKIYAGLILAREGKHYSYHADSDIVEWDRVPDKKILKDGQVFKLGGRNVTIYHCPGHSPGECVAIDDLTGTLFTGDACNNNLLMGNETGKTARETVEAAYHALSRIWGMKESYNEVYNSHHDFRGFGSPLSWDVLPNAVACLQQLIEGKATYKTVADSLPMSDTAGEKMVAEYKNVQISLINGKIDQLI